MAIVSRGDGDLQTSMYVLFSKEFEDMPCLPEDFDYSFLSKLRDAGELPVLTVARPQMHPPIVEGSDYSAYSDTYYLLPRKEWFYIDLVTTLHGGAWFEDDEKKNRLSRHRVGSRFQDDRVVARLHSRNGHPQQERHKLHWGMVRANIARRSPEVSAKQVPGRRRPLPMVLPRCPGDGVQ